METIVIDHFLISNFKSLPRLQLYSTYDCYQLNNKSLSYQPTRVIAWKVFKRFIIYKNV